MNVGMYVHAWLAYVVHIQVILSTNYVWLNTRKQVGKLWKGLQKGARPNLLRSVLPQIFIQRHLEIDAFHSRVRCMVDGQRNKAK